MKIAFMKIIQILYQVHIIQQNTRLRWKCSEDPVQAQWGRPRWQTLGRCEAEPGPRSTSPIPRRRKAWVSSRTPPGKTKWWNKNSQFLVQPHMTLLELHLLFGDKKSRNEEACYDRGSVQHCTLSGIVHYLVLTPGSTFGQNISDWRGKAPQLKSYPISLEYRLWVCVCFFPEKCIRHRVTLSVFSRSVLRCCTIVLPIV